MASFKAFHLITLMATLQAKEEEVAAQKRIAQDAVASHYETEER